MGLLVFALTFLIVIVIFLGIWTMIGGDTKQEVVRRRMDAVRKAERRGDVSMGLKLARDEMLSSVPAVHRLMLHWSWSVQLQERISQAGLTMKAGKLILISACLCLGTMIASGLFIPVFPVGILLGLCLGAVPYGVVMYLRQKRLRAFEERFPEALDLLGPRGSRRTRFHDRPRNDRERVAGPDRERISHDVRGAELRSAAPRCAAEYDGADSVDRRTLFRDGAAHSERNGRQSRRNSRWTLTRDPRPLPNLSRSSRAHRAGTLDGRHPDRATGFHDDCADGDESGLYRRSYFTIPRACSR